MPAGHVAVRTTFSPEGGPGSVEMIMCGYRQALVSRLRLALCLILVGLLLPACRDVRPVKTYTIGVMNYVPYLESVLAGFKARMTELGYVEGHNVIYLYHGVIANDPAALEAEVKRLLSQKVDLLLTMGTPTTLAAKQGVTGTDIPVVFVPLVQPVKEGIVESIKHPGGNVTGVQSVNDAPKALEWLLKLVPATKLVYVPYHPQDQVSVQTIAPLPDAAARLGVSLVFAKVQTPEEVTAALTTLPQEAAILFIPTPGLEAWINMIRSLAMTHAIPVGGYNRPADNLLLTCTTDRAAQGQQAARLVDQIFKGAKPAELPVETAESFVQINLQTATAIGLEIPDELLRLADIVLR